MPCFLALVWVHFLLVIVTGVTLLHVFIREYLFVCSMVFFFCSMVNVRKILSASTVFVDHPTFMLGFVFLWVFLAR